MVILPCDVLFVWGDGFISDAIECVTHGASHVAMFINENTICEAQGGRSIGECPLSFYMDNPDVERLEVWRDLTITDEDRTKMLQIAKTWYGAEYDYWLIPLELIHFKLGINLDWIHENRHRICSTYVYDIASDIGHKWAKVTNPAPADIQNGGKLQKIYTLRGE